MRLLRRRYLARRRLKFHWALSETPSPRPSPPKRGRGGKPAYSLSPASGERAGVRGCETSNLPACNISDESWLNPFRFRARAKRLLLRQQFHVFELRPQHALAVAIEPLVQQRGVKAAE